MSSTHLSANDQNVSQKDMRPRFVTPLFVSKTLSPDDVPQVLCVKVRLLLLLASNLSAVVMSVVPVDHVADADGDEAHDHEEDAHPAENAELAAEGEPGKDPREYDYSTLNITLRLNFITISTLTSVFE